jgi:hypothetical protein
VSEACIPSSSATAETTASLPLARQPGENGLASASKSSPAAWSRTPPEVQSMQANSGVSVSNPKELNLSAKKAVATRFPWLPTRRVGISAHSRFKYAFVLSISCPELIQRGYLFVQAFRKSSLAMPV